MFARTRNLALKASAAAGALLAAGAASAQGATTFTDVLNAVNLSGVEVAVGAAALLIVGIAMMYKSPTLAKRIINKV